MSSPRAPRLLVLGASVALLTTGCFSSSTGSGGSDAAAAEGRISLAMLQPPRSGLSPLSDDAFKLSRWKTAETLVELDELGEALLVLVEFVQKVLAIRRSLPMLRRGRFLTGQYDEELGVKDVTWLTTTGEEMTPEHWTDPNGRCMGVLLDGRFDEVEELAVRARRLDTNEATGSGIYTSEVARLRWEQGRRRTGQCRCR